MASFREEVEDILEEALLCADDEGDGRVSFDIDELKEALRPLMVMDANDLLERGLALLEDDLDDSRGPDLSLGFFMRGLAYVVAAYHDDPSFREALRKYETDVQFEGQMNLDPPGFLANLEELARVGHVQGPPETKKGKAVPENDLHGWKGAQFWRSLLALVPQRALEDAGYLRMEP